MLYMHIISTTHFIHYDRKN